MHPLSNVFAPIRAKNAREFRGAARGVGMSSNFRTFAPIFSNYRPRCGDFPNYNKFAAYVQKRLDTRPRCGYNGAGKLIGFSLRFCTGAERLAWFDLIGPKVKKRLDIHRFCTYTGAGTTFGFTLRFCTGAPAPKSRSQWGMECK